VPPHAQEKSEGHIKNFSAGAPHLQIGSDATAKHCWVERTTAMTSPTVSATYFLCFSGHFPDAPGSASIYQNISNFGFRRSCRWWRWWVVAGCPSCHPTNSVKTL